jgi:hypothetical protein
MKCKACGAEIKEGAKFCIMCGAKVERGVKVATNLNANDFSEQDKLATHSECIFRKGDGYSRSTFRCEPFNSIGEAYRGKLYIVAENQKVMVIDEKDHQVLSVITSKDKNFDGTIAVNCQGIFRKKRDSKEIYVYSEEGQLKSKIKIKARENDENIYVPTVYIYDNYIYSIYSKTNSFVVYRYDINNPEEEEIVFDYEDTKDDIFSICNEHLRKYNIDDYKIDKTSRIKIKKICANNNRLILAFDLGNKGSDCVYDDNCLNVVLSWSLDENVDSNIRVASSRKGAANALLSVNMENENVYWMTKAGNQYVVSKMKLDLSAEEKCCVFTEEQSRIIENQRGTKMFFYDENNYIYIRDGMEALLKSYNSEKRIYTYKQGGGYEVIGSWVYLDLANSFGSSRLLSLDKKMLGEKELMLNLNDCSVTYGDYKGGY